MGLVVSANAGEGGGVEGTKICCRCHEKKPLTVEHFTRNRSHKTGFQAYCKPCGRAYMRELYARDPEKRLVQARAWNAANPGKQKAAVERWRVNNVAKVATTRLKSELARYGLTIDDYDALSVRQGGLCAICRRADEGKRLSVDHDHESGAVRGLLCSKCNIALGNLRDDPDLMMAAAEYVRCARGAMQAA